MLRSALRSWHPHVKDATKEAGQIKKRATEATAASSSVGSNGVEFGGESVVENRSSCTWTICERR